jgi:hypothetical protein
MRKFIFGQNILYAKPETFAATMLCRCQKQKPRKKCTFAIFLRNEKKLHKKVKRLNVFFGNLLNRGGTEKSLTKQHWAEARCYRLAQRFFL